MKLMFLGAPATGKSTQGEITGKRLGIPLISTGAMLRAEIAEGTERGLAAKGFIQRGELVPDDVVIQMVAARLERDDCKNGFMLDGFPRTIAQAKALEDMGVNLDMIISVEAPDELLIKRVTGRRVCSKCASSYHIMFSPPAVDGVCDKCGGELISRKDDSVETASERLRVYHEITAPLKEYYGAKGILFEVDGSGSIESIAEIIRETIDKVSK